MEIHFASTIQKTIIISANRTKGQKNKGANKSPLYRLLCIVGLLAVAVCPEKAVHLRETPTGDF